ncbi:hypothetical protein [Nostoc sphaeroides]|uniref:Uncharacterized protein n=1 Tax=Nostoc sphaeroides CCNUC1 TaxID=2653204 RepID=A0A5P8WJY0_9NOSO|nr:hypothetical protein [Nostoc sphaeroides]QFS52159.1 hypothetical protein GXM_09653 [Nostoc sphaeroides CCNUC1]
MKVIVTVVEKIISEAHIDIPDGLNQSAIKQHIVDRYNSGEMVTDKIFIKSILNQSAL